jgi:hypothetical protein
VKVKVGALEDYCVKWVIDLRSTFPENLSNVAVCIQYYQLFPNINFQGSFWLRDILNKLLDSFKGMAMVSLKDGASYVLWHDLWGGRVLSQAFPELYSFTRNHRISVQLTASTPMLQSLFHLPCLVRPMSSSKNFLLTFMACGYCWRIQDLNNVVQVKKGFFFIHSLPFLNF